MGSVLRDDAQIATDQAAAWARRLADDYRDAAGLVEDPGLAALFSELATERGQMADRLGEAVRALGDLPSEPDPDRESVLKLVRHARHALSRDDRLTLLREAERHEDALGHRLAEALGEADLGPARAPVEAAVEQVHAAQRRLAEARARVTTDRSQ